jgi:predicted PurR-regulated permease PerM
MPRGLTRRQIRIVMVVVAVAAVLVILYTARGSLAPFFVGTVFVLVCAPIVDAAARGMPFHERHPDLALSLSIGLLYLALTMAVVGVGAAWGPRLLSEGRELANGLPNLVQRVQHEVQDNNGWYQQNVPPDIRNQIDQNWQKIASQASQYGKDVVSRTVSFATNSITTIVSYIVVPFWAFFVLKDRRRGMRAFLGLFPESVRADVHHVLTNARAVFGSYLQAQILLSSVTAVVTVVGLMAFGVPFAIPLGVVAGVANLIPVLGPMIGGIPTLVVVSATHPGWLILWVFLFLFISQELKDFILVPRIQGHAVGIHPAIVLVLIVVAGHLAGFWGLLFAVPLAAVLRDSFVYIYKRLGDETRPTPQDQASALPEAVARHDPDLPEPGTAPLPEPSGGRRR